MPAADLLALCPPRMDYPINRGTLGRFTIERLPGPEYMRAAYFPPGASAPTVTLDGPDLLDGPRFVNAVRAVAPEVADAAVIVLHETARIASRRAAEDASPPRLRPQLDVTKPSREVTDSPLWELVTVAEGESPTLFRYGDQLVRLATTDRGRTVTVPMTVHTFRAFVDERLKCVKSPKNGDPYPVHPPFDLCRMAMNYSAPPVPVLHGIVTAPPVGEDWRARTVPGYNATDGLLYVPEFAPLAVPDTPTPEDVAEARRLIDEELLGDFGLAATDLAAAVGLLLLGLVRHRIDGPTPLHLFDAPRPGTGKTLLCSVLLLSGLGLDGRNTLALPKESEELRKLVTALLLESRPAVVFDNVTGAVRHGVLAKLLTDRVHADRRLGVNVSTALDVRLIWAMTGNNVQLSDELVRRTVLCRLEVDVEHPEDRTGFRHADLTDFTMKNRARLVWAGHVMIRHWASQGCPEPLRGVAPLGSYEAYRSVIGGILGAAGYEGWLDNRKELRASDQDSMRWGDFTLEWAARFGYVHVKVIDLLPLALEADIPVNGDGDRARTASLGMLLSIRRGQVFAGRKIEHGSGRARRSWRLVGVGDTYDTFTGAETAGDDESVTPVPPVTPKSVPSREKNNYQGIAGDGGVTGGTGVTGGPLCWPPPEEEHAH